MLPTIMPAHMLKQQTRLNKQTIREAGSLTTYLKEKATPEEKAAYNRAWKVGSKAGSGPRTIADLRAYIKGLAGSTGS